MLRVEAVDPQFERRRLVAPLAPVAAGAGCLEHSDDLGRLAQRDRPPDQRQGGGEQHGEGRGGEHRTSPVYRPATGVWRAARAPARVGHNAAFGAPALTSSDLGTPRPPATASPRRLARLAAAVALSFASLLYGGLWSWQTLREYDVLSDRLGLAHDALASRRVELGFDIEYSARLRAVSVTGVRRDTPAEAAGVRTGDRIVAVDGRAVRDSAAPFGEIYLERQAGDTVDLAVVRGDARQPVVLRAVFRARTLPRSLPALLRLVFQSRILFPFVMLAVALPVLFYRVDDAHAWRLALLFAGLIAAPGFPNDFAGVEGPLRAFATCYRSLLGGLSGALFYWFFAAFPTRSAFDRHLPALKWLLLGMGLLFGAAGLGQGSAWLPASAASWLGAAASRALWLAYSYGATAFALAALAQSAWRPPTADARRKIQVIAWGTLVGVVPAVALGTGRRPRLAAARVVGRARVPAAVRCSRCPSRTPSSATACSSCPSCSSAARATCSCAAASSCCSRCWRWRRTRCSRSRSRGCSRSTRTFATSVGVGFGLALASAGGARRAPGHRPHRPRVLPRAYDARVDPRAAGRAHPHGREPGRAGARCSSSRSRAALQPGDGRRLPPFAAGPAAGVRDGLVPAELARPPALDDLARAARPREASGRDGEPLVPALAPLAPGIPRADRRARRAARPGRARRSGCRRSRTRARTCACSRRSRRRRRSRSRTCASPRASPSASTPSGAPRARWSSRARCRRSCCRARAAACPRSSATGRCVQARAVGGDYFDFLDAPGGTGSASCSPTCRARASRRRC